MRALLFILAGTLVGCATARPLRPLAPGTAAAEVAVPGVLVRTDTYRMPVGVLLLGARYGLTNDVELRARFHAMTLVKGIVGLEGGAVYHAFTPRGLGPGLHLTGDLAALTSPTHWGRSVGESVRGAASVGLLADVAPLEWLRPYAGLEQTVVLYDGAYVASALVGVQVNLGRFELSLETGLAGFNRQSRGYTEPYVGIGGHGAVWLSWGLAYRFGGEGP
jgi:hypothetical protein